MKSALRKLVPFVSRLLVAMAVAAMPLLAAEEGPEPAETPLGFAFRWLHFAVVFGGLVYLIRKFGAPYFRSHARSIASSIHRAAEDRAAAERELNEAGERLAALGLEVQDLRRAATRESATEAERIRELRRLETEKIGQAARVEIEAAERAARQELRSLAARLATEKAAALVRARMTAKVEAVLFRSFIGELQRSAQ